MTLDPRFNPSSPPPLSGSNDLLFRALLDSAPDAMVIADYEGNIQLANRQVERLFGYREQELVGQSVEVLVPERFRHGHVAKRDSYLLHPTPRPMGEGRLLFARRKDGTEFPAEISLGPLQTEQGLLISSAIRDITERKQTEQALAEKVRELARSNADLEQFAYIASHDLQEPLRAVAGCVHLLKQGYGEKLDARADEFIRHTVEGVTRMQALIEDLLTYSRAGGIWGAMETVDMGEILQTALTNLSPLIQEAHAQVQVGELPKVTGNRTQLLQLVQNLLSNAVKFHSEARPIIEVQAQRDGSDWAFSVQDNGIGIEAQYFERIFRLFQRLHTRRAYPGTGLGLAICKKIIENHGGRIWVESTPGHGATFFFTLSDGDQPS
jgi:PAS domain S-box-containing protein